MLSAPRRLLVSSSVGFSLLEVLVAIGLLGGAVAALGQLVVMAGRANMSARTLTLTVVLAAQKMEQLRAEPSLPAAGGAMQHDADGFVDYLDAHGRALPGGQPAGASFVRRWMVEPPPFDPARSRVLRVRVLRLSSGRAVVPAWPGTGADEARLLGVVTEHDR